VYSNSLITSMCVEHMSKLCYSYKLYAISYLKQNVMDYLKRRRKNETSHHQRRRRDDSQSDTKHIQHVAVRIQHTHTQTYKHYTQVRIQCALFTFLIHSTAAASSSASSAAVSAVAVAIDVIIGPPLAFVPKTGTGRPALVRLARR